MKSTSSTTRQKARESSPLLWSERAFESRLWEPEPEQIAAVEYLIDRDHAALWLEPGFGKTSITLAAFSLLKEKGYAKRMLLIAPLRPCYLTWPLELKKWVDFHHLRMVVLHGKDKDELAHDEADIYAINPEGLSWLIHSREKHFRRLKFDVLCIDESTKFKNYKSQRTKTLMPILDKFDRRWTLTGTPSPNSMLDVFQQVFITDKGRALGTYVTAFRDQYFDNLGEHIGNKWVIRKGAKEQIYKRLKPVVFSMPVSKKVKVPVIRQNDIYVDLPDKARNIYDDMEAEAFAELDQQRTVTAMSASAAMMKCAQIASGGIYLDMDEEHLRRATRGIRDTGTLHGVKTDALEDLIDELQGSPAFIAYEFQHDVERIKARFGQDIPVIGGKGSNLKRDFELQDRWNRGEFPFMLGHPASVGHGLNLQLAGNTVIWYTLTWNLELYEQFNKRIARQGCRYDHVYVHRIIARSTVDEAKVDALARKDRDQNALMAAVRTYIDSRRKVLKWRNPNERNTRVKTSRRIA
jgi:SNF2 family DNA or RNA helicase